MAAMKLAMCVATLCLLMVSIQCNPQDPKSKARQTRGFRNSALSTARGFGKRTFAHGLDPFLHSATADGTVISASWLSEQMSKNPEIAQLIVDRFVDTDGDGQVAMDELVRDL